MYILIPVAGLAVTDPSAGGSELDVTSFQDFDVIHAVLAAQNCQFTRRNTPQTSGMIAYCLSSPRTM